MKREILIVALVALAGAVTACGFQPVYGTHGAGDESVAAQMNTVAIDNIPDRKGQILRNDLIDRMYGKGRPQQPLYRLSIKLRMTEEDVGIQLNATSTRSLINMYGDYVLTDMQGHAIIKGTAHSVSSFNTLVDEYGNLSALNDAIERTVNEVSEQIVNRLGLYFAEKDEGHTPPPPQITTPGTSQQAVPVVLPNAVSLTPQPTPTPAPNAVAQPSAAPQPAVAEPAPPVGGPLPDPRLPPSF